jgi:hypothetical protein
MRGARLTVLCSKGASKRSALLLLSTTTKGSGQDNAQTLLQVADHSAIKSSYSYSYSLHTLTEMLQYPSIPFFKNHLVIGARHLKTGKKTVAQQYMRHDAR